MNTDQLCAHMGIKATETHLGKEGDVTTIEALPLGATIGGDVCMAAPHAKHVRCACFFA